MTTTIDAAMLWTPSGWRSDAGFDSDVYISYAHIDDVTMIFGAGNVYFELQSNGIAEQDKANIHDPTHFAYPTYAKAAIQRRENLTRSADELRVQLEDAKSLLSEAFEELKKVELLDERDQARERAEESAREQADMDSIGLMRARLGGAIA